VFHQHYKRDYYHPSTPINPPSQAESYGAKYLATSHPAMSSALYGGSELTAALPKAYGLVALVNVVVGLALFTRVILLALRLVQLVLD
jgi:hypothetical protein